MSASKFTFESKSKDLKATCPMKSGWIVVHENVDFSSMTITKQRLEACGWNFANCWAEVENSCIILYYGSNRIARTGENFGKTELLPLRLQERISELQIWTDHSKGERCNCWDSPHLEITGDRLFSRTSVLSIHVSIQTFSVVQNKASLQ